MNNDYQWIPFYEALADKLLEYKDKRKELHTIMIGLSEKEPLLKYLHFERDDWWGTKNFEIDPFTIVGSFNRGITEKNRISLANIYAEIFDVNVPMPNNFAGIPVLFNMSSILGDNGSILWDLFIEAMKYSETKVATDLFKAAFDKAIAAQGNGLASITMGLYWIRPNIFINLDSTNMSFIPYKFNLAVPDRNATGEEYLQFLKIIKQEVLDIPFPEISRLAWSHMLEERKSNEYTPNLSVNDWTDLLKDETIFNASSLEILKRLKDYGGKATCTQLSNKYGETVNFYNRGASALAQRIYKETHCKVYDEDGNIRWWRILFTGSIANKVDEGSFYWILRDELKEALKEVDLSEIKLYASDSSVEETNGELYSENYWWLNASPKVWSFSSISVGEEVEYTLLTENNRKRRVYQNFLDAKIGDKVICYETNPEKKIIALGEISKEQDGEKISVRKIEDLLVPIEYEVLKESPELSNFQFLLNPNGMIFKVAEDEYNFIMDLIREVNPKVSVKETKGKYDKTDFLNEVYLSEEEYDTLTALLINKKNIILQGAPGVGKTFAAKRLAWSMIGEKDDSRIEMIQFHQNYSYEDFIMGYKPKEDGFELQDGIFVNFCRKAANDSEHDYFLIIDEINRGNMSKVFGELLMLIENDYRETKIKLPYNGKLFSVPKNLYIIGMMNTADRSLAMIDYALRRRFSFYEMEPSFDSEGFKEYQAILNNETFNKLIEYTKSLNLEIAADPTLGKGFCIGHSYFTGQEECTDGSMELIVKYDILPMLKEYWFDEDEKVNSWASKFKGVLNAKT